MVANSVAIRRHRGLLMISAIAADSVPLGRTLRLSLSFTE